MKNYDEIISLGTQCNPGLSLRELNLKKETYPFDWVRSNSKIIYDILLNGKDKYITFDEFTSDDYYTKHLDSIDFKKFPNSHINSYGQYFTHYIKITSIELINKFNNYFKRFFNILNSNKKVLFIHSHEEYIYHKINNIIEDRYPDLIFEIINIDIDNTFENYKNIINLNMKYNLPISDNSETHKPKYYDPYRNTITNIIKEWLE
jgi:hypothetical protein